MLDYDAVFAAMSHHGVRFVLIGGLNFFLRYQPVATRDIDLFVEDTPENLRRCEAALIDLNASWGSDESDWGPVERRAGGWLGSQAVYCLLCDAGELDIFTRVSGLGPFDEVFGRAERCTTRAGSAYWSLSRQEMIACQVALPESLRKLDRVRYLEGLDQEND